MLQCLNCLNVSSMVVKVLSSDNGDEFIIKEGVMPTFKILLSDGSIYCCKNTILYCFHIFFKSMKTCLHSDFWKRDRIYINLVLLLVSNTMQYFNSFYYFIHLACGQSPPCPMMRRSTMKHACLEETNSVSRLEDTHIIHLISTAYLNLCDSIVKDMSRFLFQKLNYF